MIDVYCDACGYLAAIPRQDPQGHDLAAVLSHHALFCHGGGAFGYTLIGDNLAEKKGTWNPST